MDCFEGAYRHRRSSSGFTVLELLTVLILLSLVTAVAAPAVEEYVQCARLREASHSLAGAMRRVRREAVHQDVAMGLVFDGLESYHVYRDGNGNGIRTADIAAGVDEWVRGPLPIDGHANGVEVAIHAAAPVPNIPPGSGSLTNLPDPIKFGSSDIVGCSPLGTCSSGTVYLSLRNGRMTAVRLAGWSGRVSLWRYEPDDKRWIRTW